MADGNGGVSVVRDGDELLAEVLFRLTARRESFPFLPELGSRMYLLRRSRPSEWDSLALQYAVEVTGARVSREDDALWVSVALLWRGIRLSVTAQLEG